MWTFFPICSVCPKTPWQMIPWMAQSSKYLSPCCCHLQNKWLVLHFWGNLVAIKIFWISWSPFSEKHESHDLWVMGEKIYQKAESYSINTQNDQTDLETDYMPILLLQGIAKLCAFNANTYYKVLLSNTSSLWH